MMGSRRVLDHFISQNHINMNPLKRASLLLAEKLYDEHGDFSAKYAPYVVLAILAVAVLVGGYGDHYALMNL